MLGTLTKRALAAAMRELMDEVPFEKIQVAHICECCNMNRKSFYYHFKDKYDLLNWIFDTEIISFVQSISGTAQLNQRVEVFQEVCNYFYKNKIFYRKALKIQGQNSFSEHLREYLTPILKNRLLYLLGDCEDDFTLNFYLDAIVCTIERWLLEKECMPPDQFVFKLVNLIRCGAVAIHNEFNR
ncbi:MAG: TetR/AcrR family transcriptional regulator C-terminal domain-containing protein [Anaerostipes sp.]|jgi:probable dihydroxyacetone kinase regulator